MDINFRSILEYLDQQSDKEYKSPQKALDEKEKDEMIKIKEAATLAVNEFKKIRNYFKQLGFTVNEGIIKWLDASNVKVRSYLWLELKSESKDKFQSSISIFAEKVKSNVRFRVTLELKESSCKEEDYLRHHRFLDILDTNKNDFQYFASKKNNLELLQINNFQISDIIEKVKNREYNKLQIGKVISKREVDSKSNLEILELMQENIEKLEPFYNKAVEENEKENINTQESNNGSKPQEKIVTAFSTSELISSILINIRNKSFIYSYKDLANFYLSLKTKPFVILAGVSGTGKSKLVRLFAEALGATKDNGQFKMISVKPDWNDNTELFGYKNISGDFIPGELTSIILEAMKAENRNKPYFVCLDEMNLARVEYYLSDYLSLIESREFQGNEIVTDKLFPYNYHEDGSVYENLYLPDNLYVVGTVNMDDTTYAISRKVLDRANTIEFSEVNLGELNFTKAIMDKQLVQNDFLRAHFLNISQAIIEDEAYVKLVNEKVIEINDILKKGNRQFGYRVRDEIVYYMLENTISGVIENEDMAFDYVIMQKILPTITGSDTKIEHMLIGLYNICNPLKQIAFTSNYIDEAEKFIDIARYNKSAKKIIEMLRGYRDGFSSYWI